MTDDELHDLYDQWQWEDRNRLPKWSPLYRTFEQWLEERAKAEVAAAAADPEADDPEAAKRAALAATLATAFATLAEGPQGPPGEPGADGLDGADGPPGPPGPVRVLHPPAIVRFEFVHDAGGRITGTISRYSDGTVRRGTIENDHSGRPLRVTYADTGR